MTKNPILKKLTTTLALAASLSMAISNSAPTAFAGPAPTAKSGPLEGVGEIFMKGSIDGKHVFMVLGVDQALKDSKGYLQNAIDLDSLKDDTKGVAHDIYNPNHENDFVDYFKSGVRFSKATAPEILKQPWKTLQGIPQAYKVDFENANKALHTTKNPTLGLVKYSGWAVWANVKGAVKLVIEVPAEFAGITVATIGAVPAMVTVQTFVTAWDVTKTIGRQAIDISWSAIELAAEDSYSLITASTASALTLVATGAVATFKGGKWLVIGLPNQIQHPISAKAETKVSYDLQKQVAAQIRDFLRGSVTKMGGSDVVADIGEFQSTITIMGTDPSGAKFALGDIKVDTRQTIFLRAEVTRKQFKNRLAANPEMSRPEVKKKILEELNQLLQDIIEQLNTNPPRQG